MESELSTNTRVATITVVSLLIGLTLLAAPALAGYVYDDLSEPVVSTTIGSDNSVVPGETTTLPITVQNEPNGTVEMTGDVEDIQAVVRTQGLTLGAASGAAVEFRSGDAPVEIKTGQRNIGSLSPGEMHSTSLTLEVDEDAAAGTYRVPVDVSYSYVENIDAWVNDPSDRINTAVDDYDVHRETVTVTRYVTVEVETTAQLSVVDTESMGLYEGADGRVSVTVRNDGTESARNAELNIVGSNQIESHTSSVAVGSLPPGEETTLTFQATANTDAAGQYATEFRMRYEGENGQVARTNVESGQVAVRTGPEFELSARAESLHVGSTGAIELTVRNTGARPATNARANVSSVGPFAPVSNSVTLGTLRPGESTTVRYRLEVGGQALPETYSVPVSVVHEDIYDNPVTATENTVDVAVGPETDFAVTDTARTQVGSTELITYTIRNTGSGTLDDAVARVNTNSPFETDDDTAYVGELAPNETATVSFTVSTGGSATPKSYTLDMSIKYDNAFDETVVTDVQPAPIEVAQPSDGPLPGSIVGGSVLVSALLVLVPIGLIAGLINHFGLLGRVN
ncbi:COG1361 S-layer family protein [Halorientalis sp.]|uniref:COG1361 S-layer family protein n=1 Tax=Halorientalis sp. TaxID=1931229 RepID=UPI002604CAC5|nr:CARDB domain-containing protein [Halorientalis sp.]